MWGFDMLSVFQRKNNGGETNADLKFYPYLFQTSGFKRVDEIRAELESQQQWDYAKSPSQALRIQDQVAKSLGFQAPYTKEQFALRKILYGKRAGTNIATYAWGLYAQSIEKTKRYA